MFKLPSTALLVFACCRLLAQTTVFNGPAGSGAFGTSVAVLPNGNYVVTDPAYDEGDRTDVGAVYLYEGKTHAQISVVKGSSPNDSIGSAGIQVLGNGNFLVRSPLWDNGSITNAGAITRCDGATGLSGSISSNNSLVGSSADEQLGLSAVLFLRNGNYVVHNMRWSGTAPYAGAVRWCDASQPVTGALDESNAMVGSSAYDFVGNNVVALENGNYVILSGDWHYGTVFRAGAVTWCNGTTGRTGVVNGSNSLVGTNYSDQVGSGGITELTNGNLVVNSPMWNSGGGAREAEAGAVTWADGATGVSGIVSSTNSLTGLGPGYYLNQPAKALPNGNYVVLSTGYGRVGFTCSGAVTWCNGITGRTGVVSNTNSLIGANTPYPAFISVLFLRNGNYVVYNPDWDNGAGAVTWANGASGVSGDISSTNSLTGSHGYNKWDHVGSTVIALSNGNYVVGSPYFSTGLAMDGTMKWNEGAVTWCNGTTGRTGVVNGSNSLLGQRTDDNVGSYLKPLPDGFYLVGSPNWDNDAVINAGAVTKVDGAATVTGIFDGSHSFTGSQANDHVGSGGITVLSNGSYVIASPDWDNDAITDAGAVTWVSGKEAGGGTVSSKNSLIGSTANDRIGAEVLYGSGPVVLLASGNYLVKSWGWDNGAVTDAGALTWCSGTTGMAGVINAGNSLVGSHSSDWEGFYTVPLAEGNYVVVTPYWDNGSAENAGAITWCNGFAATTGVIGNTISLVGTQANDWLGNSNAVQPLATGDYVVRASSWNNGAIGDAGAVTWGNSATNLTGTINGCNSVVGQTETKGYLLNYSFSPVYRYLVVGLPAENKVSIYSPTGMLLPVTKDSSVVSIHGRSPVPLLSNSGCRILGTLTASGSSPVEGSVQTKVWLEHSLIDYRQVPFVSRHYQITPAMNAASATARITLYFTQNEFDLFNASGATTLKLPANETDAQGKTHLRIASFGGTSSDGSGLPGTYNGGKKLIDPSEDDIVWNAQRARWEISVEVTGFSGFFVQSTDENLPLQLLEFAGRRVNEKAILDWTTTGETRTHAFDVERSKEGEQYVRIGTVMAANRPGEHHYSFVDENPASLGVPAVYYRLKQVDADGQFLYSKTVAVFMGNGTSNVLFYPNPAGENATLVLSLRESEQINARIIDNAGRVVKQYRWELDTGRHALAIDVRRLAKGTYCLQLRGKKLQTHISFVKN